MFFASFLNLCNMRGNMAQIKNRNTNNDAILSLALSCRNKHVFVSDT